jgi:hypothetical protein
VRRSVWLGIALLAAFSVRGLSAPPAPSASGGYSLEIKIAPKADAPRQYVCEATATDLATGRVVFAPRLEVLAGKSNVASSSDEGGKRDFLLSVSVEGEGKEARYTLEIREGDALVGSQKASVKLR